MRHQHLLVNIICSMLVLNCSVLAFSYLLDSWIFIVIGDFFLIFQYLTKSKFWKITLRQTLRNYITVTLWSLTHNKGYSRPNWTFDRMYENSILAFNFGNIDFVGDDICNIWYVGDDFGCLSLKSYTFNVIVANDSLGPTES